MSDHYITGTCPPCQTTSVIAPDDDRSHLVVDLNGDVEQTFVCPVCEETRVVCWPTNQIHAPLVEVWHMSGVTIRNVHRLLPIEASLRDFDILTTAGMWSELDRWARLSGTPA
jgi:hypothetical protein